MEYELNDILTVEDLMEILNIGKNTAYSLLESGELRLFALAVCGRFRGNQYMTTLTEK